MKEGEENSLLIESLNSLFQNSNSIVFRKKENSLLLEEGEENSLLIESLNSLFQNSNSIVFRKEENGCYWKKEKKIHMIGIESLSFFLQNLNSIVFRKEESGLLLEEGEENSYDWNRELKLSLPKF